MLDPKQIKSIINKSDIILDILSKRNKLVFKLPIVRTQVVFLGFQFVYNGGTREELTDGLINLGFDNLRVMEIIESLVFLEGKLFEWKTNPKRITDPVKLAARKTQVEAQVKKNVARGKF